MSAVTQPLSFSRSAFAMRARDYAELTKTRVTTLVVLTAWCGYYFGRLKSGFPSLSWGLLHALVGVGLVSGGTAALNEVMEHDVDGHMRRTALRPLPTGRMSLRHGTIVGLVMTVGGALYLDLALNTLTGTLALLTAFVYLAAYTPLKKVHPICTLVGALALGIALLYVGSRLTMLKAPLSAPHSKQRARQLLQATVVYLPLLFVLMMLNRISS